MSLLLHSHRLVYFLMVYSLQKAENITRKAKDIQNNNINLFCGKWSLNSEE